MTVAGRVLKQFMRDRRTFAMMLIFPIIFMLVFGIVLSGEVNNIPITIEIADIGFTNPFNNESRTIANEIYDILMLDIK